MEKPKIAVFGDILLDRYDYCENRDNPESSAPCHRVSKTTFLPGGAGNVATNLAKLGAEPILFGLIGEDEHGNFLSNELNKKDIDKKILINNNIQTIVKQRLLSAIDGRYHGRLDFGDSEEQVNQIKSLNNQIIEHVKNNLTSNYNAFLVSDYSKGFISEELLAILKSKKIPIYVDFKKDKGIGRGVELVKPNKIEISLMVKNGSIREKAHTLSKELDSNVLLTLGGDGMYYVDRDGSTFSLPANKVDVSDVTGSGDSAISTLVFYRSIGKSIKESIILSNIAAGLNVQHIGCFQATRKEIEDVYFNKNL